MRHVSAIVCTHNPRPNYFSRCLAALEAQTLSRDKWELIVIDNASAAGAAPSPNLSWHPHATFLREEKLGLTAARLRGIEESKGDLLVFVDDDNVLDPDFLETAVRISEEKPFLGSWSGQCRAEFEATPPDWTRRYWGSLVIREFDTDVWSNLPRFAASMPCGAGLCLRRQVALLYTQLHESGHRRFTYDRVGASLVSGGDNDLAACACRLGLGIGLMSSLKLTHLIPAERLTADYLVRLIEGIEFSSTLLDAEWGTLAASPAWRRRLKDWLHVMQAPSPHRDVVRAGARGRERALRLLASRT